MATLLRRCSSLSGNLDCVWMPRPGTERLIRLIVGIPIAKKTMHNRQVTFIFKSGVTIFVGEHTICLMLQATFFVISAAYPFCNQSHAGNFSIVWWHFPSISQRTKPPWLVQEFITATFHLKWWFLMVWIPKSPWVSILSPWLGWGLGVPPWLKPASRPQGLIQSGSHRLNSRSWKSAEKSRGVLGWVYW